MALSRENPQGGIPSLAEVEAAAKAILSMKEVIGNAGATSRKEWIGDLNAHLGLLAKYLATQGGQAALFTTTEPKGGISTSWRALVKDAVRNAYQMLPPEERFQAASRPDSSDRHQLLYDCFLDATSHASPFLGKVTQILQSLEARVELNGWKREGDLLSPEEGSRAQLVRRQLLIGVRPLDQLPTPKRVTERVDQFWTEQKLFLRIEEGPWYLYQKSKVLAVGGDHLAKFLLGELEVQMKEDSYPQEILHFLDLFTEDLLEGPRALLGALTDQAIPLSDAERRDRAILDQKSPNRDYVIPLWFNAAPQPSLMTDALEALDLQFPSELKKKGIANMPQAAVRFTKLEGGIAEGQIELFAPEALRRHRDKKMVGCIGAHQTIQFTLTHLKGSWQLSKKASPIQVVGLRTE